MRGVNKVILIGNLGRDPEIRYTTSGQAVANFTIATTEGRTNKEGDKQEKLEVKAAVLDNAVMSGADVEKQLASMPGKDELRAMLLATLQAPAQNLVAQLQAPLQNLVYVLEARRKQLEESSGG